jgi:hypothetical protein
VPGGAIITPAAPSSITIFESASIWAKPGAETPATILEIDALADRQARRLADLGFTPPEM